jgi:F0F1-type ATP synthase membrane subunit c/vacuolar-type H+-ATPase subunit K
MKVLVLCIALASPQLAFGEEAQPTIAPTGTRILAASTTLVADDVPTQRQNSDLFWGGVAMAAIGGAMLGHGIAMSDPTVTCSGYYAITCSESGGNRLAWLGVGAAVAGAGFVMGAIGGKRVAIVPSRNGVQVLSTVKF